VPIVSGEYKIPLAGNIEYNITNLQLTSINIGSYSNSLNVGYQVTNLNFADISATLTLNYAFFQDNFLKFPKGQGTVTVIASGGSIQLGIGNKPAGQLYLASSSIAFSKFDIKLTTTFSFLYNLLLSAFQIIITPLLNKQLQTAFSQGLTNGFSNVEAIVPDSFPILNSPYTTTVGLAYATPIVAATSVREYLELEYDPINGTNVTSCDCPIERSAIPSIDDMNGEDYDVVAAIPESTVNTLFWTLQQNGMLSFTIPAAENSALSSLFPNHPCDLHIDSDRAPVMTFNQSSPDSAVAYLYLKFTAIDSKTGGIFVTFTGDNVALFNFSIKSSDFNSSAGYYGAAVELEMESLNLEISNIKFFGISVPDWMLSLLTSKLETMIETSVEQQVNTALAAGIALPFPAFVGVQNATIEFKDSIARLKMSIEVM